MRSATFVPALLAMLAVPVLPAAQDDTSTETREQIAKLKQFLKDNGRDVGVYEVQFAPIALDRIVMQERSGLGREFHYLTFRLRNAITDSARFVEKDHTRFNEVMEAIVREYEGMAYDKEGGVKLVAAGAQNIDDEQLKTLVKLEAMEVKTRKVRLSVLATDENKTAFRLFDEWKSFDKPAPAADAAPAAVGKPVAKAAAARDEYAFADLGDTRTSDYYYSVHQAVEEQVGQRLLTVGQIAAMDLKPYNPAAIDPELGWPEGQVDGVFIFERLPATGDFFTVSVQGLSNKLRFQVPEHAPGKVEDYFNTRILRRTYVMRFDRPGDEHFLDLRRFEMREHGWRWEPSFQRLRHRASIAYAKYFLDNIAAKGADGEDRPNQEVFDQFWAYFNKARNEELPAVYQSKRQGVEAQQAAIDAYYKAEMEERRWEADRKLVEARRDAERQAAAKRIEAIEQAVSALPTALPSDKEFLNTERVEKMLQERGGGGP